MSVNIVNFSEARKNFKSVIDTVANDKNCTFIVRGDTEDVVIMSKSYYDSLMEICKKRSQNIKQVKHKNMI